MRATNRLTLPLCALLCVLLLALVSAALWGKKRRDAAPRARNDTAHLKAGLDAGDALAWRYPPIARGD